ncbi:MAG: hypothetical protein ACKPBV_12150 [Sphaerospermopsis kisseleviana]
MRSRFFLIGVLAAYVAAAWFVYGRTLDAPFLLDDQAAIQFNEAIRTVWPPWVALNPPPADVSFARRPVTNFTMALNYALGDLRVEGYRVFNLLLHATNAFLLFLLVRVALVRSTNVSAVAAFWTALFSGLVWTIHPVATSAVHYVIQRMELVVAFGFLLMCWAQLRSIDAAHPRRWLGLAVFACLIGMGGKETMALAPILAVLLDRCATAWTWREQWRQRGYYYGLLAATWIWPAMRLISFSADGVFGADLEFRWRYFLTVAEGVIRHATLVVWPQDQVFDYGTRLVGELGDVALQFFAVTVAAGFVFWGLHRRSIAAWAGAVAFGILLPSWINLVPGQPVSEHRFYLPSGMLIALLCGGVGVWCAHRASLQRPAVALAIIVSLSFAWIGRDRASLYADPAALMRADVTAWPRSDRGHMNLGLVLESREDYPAAARQYELAMMGRPELANWRPVIALARLKMRAGDRDGAVALAADAFRRVLSLEGAPDLPGLIRVLIPSFRSAGGLDATLPLLRAAEATGLYPLLISQTIRVVAAETGGLQSIEGGFLGSSNGDPLERINYAVALAREGKNSEAIAQLDRLLSDAPPDSDPLNLAEIHALRGAMNSADPATAAASFEEALRLNPSHAEALNNFAWLLASADQKENYDPHRAVELARKAVRLRPDETNFQGTLAVALAGDAQLDEAEAVLVEAQRLGRINGNANPELPDLVRAAAERRTQNR